MTGALFTWGYGGKKPADLLRVVEQLKITHVVDCRRRPQTRIPGFSGAALFKLFQGTTCVYTQQGELLGGYPPGSVMPAEPPPVSDIAMEMLRQAACERGQRVLLVCAEKAPGDCHRHITIALPLAKMARERPEWWPVEVDIRHVYEGTLIDPIELQRSIDDPDPEAEYECETLEEDEAAVIASGITHHDDCQHDDCIAFRAARAAVCECRVPGPGNGNSRCRAPLRAVCQCACHTALDGLR